MTRQKIVVQTPQAPLQQARLQVIPEEHTQAGTAKNTPKCRQCFGALWFSFDYARESIHIFNIVLLLQQGWEVTELLPVTTNSVTVTKLHSLSSVT